MTLKEIKDQCSASIQTFEVNADSVKGLIEFDNLLLGIAITSVGRLVDDLKKVKGITNPHLTAESTLKQLQKIKTNNSLAIHYQKMYNSCLVLLVSYFTSAVSEIFRECVRIFVTSRDGDFEKEEFKISLGELKSANFNLSDSIGTLIINKNDFSFQDMKSISAAFKSYFGVDLEKNESTNNIIVAHACRHLVVHTDGTVNEKTVRMIKNANPRTLVPTLAEGQVIQFSPSDLSIVANSMRAYLTMMASKLSAV